MEKSEHSKRTHEQELQRYANELARYHQKSVTAHTNTPTNEKDTPTPSIMQALPVFEPMPIPSQPPQTLPAFDPNSFPTQMTPPLPIMMEENPPMMTPTPLPIMMEENPPMMTPTPLPIMMEENPSVMTASTLPIGLPTTPQEDYQTFKLKNPKTGYLKVRAMTARRTYPVEDAMIEVSKTFESGKYVIGTLITGIGGVSEVIELPAPDKSLSESPGNTDLFTTIDVIVSREGYIEMYYKNLPVFDGITSIQTADLLPISAASDGMTSIEVIEREPTDL